MKRIMIVLACLTLILCAAASASAQGLPDLNTSSGLRVLLGPLPDPAVSLGRSGELYQAGFNYQNGVTYDTYLYDKPADKDAFTAAYTEAAEQAGYAVSQGKEQDNDALYIISPAADHPAILLLNYQGHMFFMVPAGDIDFVPEAKPEPTALPILNYMRMDYNGVIYQGKPAYGETDSASFSSVSQTYAMSYFFHEAAGPFTQVFITWPGNATVGSSYTILARDDSKNSYQNGIYFELDDTKLIAHDVVFKHDCGRADYFTLTVARIEETELGRMIECSFECELGTAGKNPVIIKDGVFSAYLP